MWYVAILYIVIFIVIALALFHACTTCEGSNLNIYSVLVWAWIITVFLFAVFGVFIADEFSQMMYMATVVSLSVLFLVFIFIWAIIDTYGYSMQTHKELHELLCKLDKGM